MDEEDYWNVSLNKAFSFDDDTGVEPNRRTDRMIFEDGNTSELSFDVASNEVPLNLLISDTDLRKVLEEQSIKETPLPKTISAEDELKILRRKLQEKLHPSTPYSVITTILAKKPFYLECFKSLDEKTQLLDEAIQCGDGDAILIIVLFIQRTLKREFFLDIMRIRPEAINQYVNFLLQKNNAKDCVEFLTSIGHKNMVSMLMFEDMIKSSDSKRKRENISFLYRDYFGQIEPNSFWSQLVLNYSNLLEWQENEKNPKLFDQSVIESLYYASAQSKWNGNETSATNSALKIAEIHQIIPSQLEWIILNERARNKVWRDLELIFIKKSWNQLKSKSFTINIPLDKTILQLHKLDAPAPVLNYFLGNISDAGHRAALALKVAAEKSVIDAYVELKDGEKLEQYLQTLKLGSENKFYGDNVLRNMKSKGK